MAIVTFTYGLHEEDNFGLCETIEQQTGIEISPELAEKIGNPFFEITVTCTLDPETGKVEMISAKMES